MAKKKLQQMIDEKQFTAYELKILSEIKRIDEKLSELNGERRALERLLLKARQERIATADVTRKNSLTRVLIEKAIIDALSAATKPVKGTDLFRRAQEVDLRLKDSTFRSYLHRLKARDVIANPTGFSGLWQLKNPDFKDS